jgi:hypothetical protein
MKKKMEPVVQFIISQQESDGSFPTYESYPLANPDAGWTKLTDSSPFITANILFSLMQLNDTRLDGPIQKAAKNLLASKEGKGFWRFWPVKSKQHPVPLDMDDTCIVSFVLARCGYHFENAKTLLNNKNREGYFETWLRPRLGNLLISPSVACRFFIDYRLAWPTLKLGHFAFNDKEPAVAANALLYLGENEQTKACIDQIIKEVIIAAIPKQFYDDDVVVYYHIARAYVNGVPGFRDIGPVMADRICRRFRFDSMAGNEMLCAMAANVLLDYNLEIQFAEKLLGLIAAGKSYPDKWSSHAYFCSKDREFISGSPGLTAAIFVEACAKLDRYK